MRSSDLPRILRFRAGPLRRRPVLRQSNGDVTLGAAELLPVPLIGSGHFGTQYDVSPDGRRIYFLDRTPAPGPSDMNLLVGWRALLK